MKLIGHFNTERLKLIGHPKTERLNTERVSPDPLGLERLKNGSALVNMMKRLENQTALDPLVTIIRPIVDRVIAPPLARPFLQGQWVGHALHPIMTDLPLGLWTGTNVLDLFPVPGSRPAAQRLLALGLLAVPATALTGWAEWREAGTREQRVGVLHAALNVGGIALYTLSLISRRRGRHGTGVTLALGGSAMTAAAGYLGGHLVAVRKVSSRHAAFGDPAFGGPASSNGSSSNGSSAGATQQS